MFDSNQSRRVRACGLALAAAAFCAAGLLAAASSAQAALGGGPMATPDGATVTSSTPAPTTASATMRNAIVSGASVTMPAASGASGTSAAVPYTVRETTLGTGTVVREYVSAGGIVFGVAWNGPALPQLSKIFGDQYYQQYSEGASAARAARGVARGPSSVEHGGIVVKSGGHMGHFIGAAWLPAQLPAGVTGDDIR
ncbi:DUF2844 domain-containing protein [Paraburkholderia rhizosphaerae]|uniref:Uncharacterized protein DUF2844 n=1 Tax=Paraburkholderia rhizosphaerae TaxID=480658 RepID=A0A4R8LVN1_9BURK|nr:DUF2844 domain-containing protein [Paraburkholderia rhizosphaerae]TDY51879.1 uncharacterized protein DUF2844 [Paraburkholderia rhizosphaerae]